MVREGKLIELEQTRAYDVHSKRVCSHLVKICRGYPLKQRCMRVADGPQTVNLRGPLPDFLARFAMSRELICLNGRDVGFARLWFSEHGPVSHMSVSMVQYWLA